MSIWAFVLSKGFTIRNLLMQAGLCTGEASEAKKPESCAHQKRQFGRRRVSFPNFERSRSLAKCHWRALYASREPGWPDYSFWLPRHNSALGNLARHRPPEMYFSPTLTDHK